MAKTSKLSSTKSTTKTTKSDASQEAVGAQPANTLLGIITYSDDAAYENFLKKMDINQAVFVLIASANYAQSRGILSLPEGELVNTAIRAIKKSSAATPQQEKTAESAKR